VLGRRAFGGLGNGRDKVREESLELGNLAQWVGALGTILAVIVALFKTEFLQWLRRPNLKIVVSLGPPECHAVPFTFKVAQDTPIQIAQSYYFRIYVLNDGKTRAEQVQVYVAGLSRPNG
jgi:cellobiose-specific phosphotransferase system component IIC